MKRILQSSLLLAAAASMGASASDAPLPNAPGNLRAEVSGQTVALSWTNSDEGSMLLYNGFEGDPNDFPFNGWSTVVTDVVDPITSWFQFPSAAYEGMDNLDRFINSGQNSAYVSFDPFVPRADDATINAYQNEWLISPTVDNAAYVVFSFFINPTLLEVGTYDEFNEHYYVMVSHDGGKEWEPVWDARYDMLPIDGYQQAVVCLGEPTPDMKFAFVAMSDPDNTRYGLHYVWALDDVYCYASAPDAVPGRVIGKAAPAGVTYRNFDTTGLTPSLAPAPAAQRRKPLAYHYNVYRDGELLVANHHALYFTDSDAKPTGTYLYEVRAAGEEGESEPASLKVAIGDVEFAPATDVNVTSGFDEDTNLYEITITWKDPEGDFQPVYYNVFCDGQSSGFFMHGDEYELTHTMVANGTYLYEVQATYENPDGESPKVGSWITVGWRSTVTGVDAQTEGNNVNLSWGMPTFPDAYELTGFDVYRGAEKIADNYFINFFTDSNVEDGAYRYYVIARYSDGSESMPVSAGVKVGSGVKLYSIPHSEDFNSGFQPDNWQTDTYYGQTPAQYQFRFDNYYGIEIEGGGFEGGFVSATNEVPAFVILANYLISPTYDIASVANPKALTLSFDYDFMGSGGSYALIQYSLDKGETWQDWGTPDMLPYYTEQDLAELGAFCCPERFSMNFSSIATAPTITFRVYYESFFDKHFALDNWSVTASDAAVQTVAGDGDALVVRRGDKVTVTANDIISARAYDFSGRLIASAGGCKGACELSVGSGFCIVKVQTPQGVRVCRLAGK